MTSPTQSSGARERIVEATADILASGGRQAVSTRAVTAAAGVQAPTLYRLFGDKQGLLDAVAVAGFTEYVGEQAGLESAADPVDALRAGWDAHVSYGIAHPHLYSIAYGDTRGDTLTPAAAAAAEVLSVLVNRAAQEGRLVVTEERAVQLLHAAGCGTVLTLVATPADQRDLGLSTAAREGVLASITTDPVAGRPGSTAGSDVARAAVQLRALLEEQDPAGLTPAERQLLDEWLGRLADDGGPRG